MAALREDPESPLSSLLAYKGTLNWNKARQTIQDMLKKMLIIFIYICTHTHTYIHIYKHTHTYIHTYTQSQIKNTNGGSVLYHCNSIVHFITCSFLNHFQVNLHGNKVTMWLTGLHSKSPPPSQIWNSVIIPRIWSQYIPKLCMESLIKLAIRSIPRRSKNSSNQISFEKQFVFRVFQFIKKGESSNFSISDTEWTTSSQEDLTAGQCHNMWIRVPTWPHPRQQRSEELGSFFFSLAGVIYALWRIFICMTVNPTDLEMAAGSLHILSHSVEFNETPKSCVHCNWV